MQFHFNESESSASLSGELTFIDHAAFRELSALLFGTAGKSIMIDLSKLETIDSAGLGMLLIARDEAKAKDRHLVLRGPLGQVKRMFQVTRFDSLFTVEA